MVCSDMTLLCALFQSLFINVINVKIGLGVDFCVFLFNFISIRDGGLRIIDDSNRKGSCSTSNGV